MRKLRAGIIGLGVGEAHIEGYRSHPNCEVAAVCDLSEPRLAGFRKKYSGLKVTTEADEILKDPEIDVVSIASYDNDHYEQMVKAIQNGKHIFVEKPICLHEKEALHIRSLLRDNPRLKISSNLILRRCPRFRRLKEMVAGGDFGELFYVEGDYDYGRLEKITEGWRGRIDFYSVVTGGALHLVDLLLWLAGDTVEEVAAYGNKIASKGSGFRYNDFVAALLKFRGGLIGKVTANFGCVRPHFHGLVLYGTKATFVNDEPHGKFFSSRDPRQPARNITEPYPGIKKGDLIYNFVDSISNGSVSEVSVEDLFKTLSVCFAIEESIQQNRPVKVRYL